MKSFITIVLLSSFVTVVQAGDLRPIPVTRETCFGKLSAVTAPPYPGSNRKPETTLTCVGRKLVTRPGLEVSALLVDRDYMEILAKAVVEAQSKQRVVILDGFTLTWHGVVQTVEAYFSTRSSRNPKARKSSLGQIQGQLAMDDAGNLVIQAISNTFYDKR